MPDILGTRVVFQGSLLISQGPTRPSPSHPASYRKYGLPRPPRTRLGHFRRSLRGTRELRPSWKYPSVRITRPSGTCCQAPQALGLRGRGREGHLLPHPRSGLLAWDALGSRGGGRFCVWEEERIPLGSLPTTLGTKPRAGPLGSWAPPPNRGHPYLKAQVIPAWQRPRGCLRGNIPWTQEGNPRALPGCFGSALLSSGPVLAAVHPGELLPSSRSSRGRGSGRQGSEKVERLGDARWEWVGVKGESGG